ncbi:MAG: hypothetical protein DWQ02_18335 [Bacteroidetes bacterium]|nr:MAG: hypothetical protein DWQ02_18335 [Bacteroidota bacterium]
MKTPVFIICLFLACTLAGQPENILNNGSFEQDGKALLSTVPMGWINYGFVRHSPPDVHSSTSNFFDVSRPAAHGDHFVGLVTRSNETWEIMGQELNAPLEIGKQYIFTVFLASNQYYRSIDATTMQNANYTAPVILRIYGMVQKQKIMLAETGVIDHEEWKKYQMKFQAEFAFQQLLLEVYYADNIKRNSNGNLLIDGCVLLKSE